MALQAIIFVDLVGLTSTLTFTLNSASIDELTYSNNSITFSSTSGFNLIKSDFLIYNSYLNVFLNSLLINFPTIQNSRGISLPISTFQINLSTSGIEHIYYVQTSSGNSIYNTNYVAVATSASFAARTSETITMQEFFVFCQLHNIYAQQVGFN
jgi:hypothetical protein